jgi:hypothetical protein
MHSVTCAWLPESLEKKLSAFDNVLEGLAASGNGTSLYWQM